MTESPTSTLVIVAATADEALALAAQQSGAALEALRIVDTRAMKTWPWQPKRATYVVAKAEAQSEAATTAPVGLDGTWTAEFREGSVWLTVTAPRAEGKRVRLDEVLAESQNWPLDEVERAKVSTIVEKASAQPEPVGLFGTAGDAPFRIVVARSGMAAYCICGKRPGRAPVSTFRTALTEAGVTHGVDDAQISAIFANWTPDATVLVARGRGPTPGTDASIEQTFASQSAQPTIREDGSVDFFASQLTAPVPAGQAIASKRPATPGTEGYTIRGEPIPAQAGKDVDLKRMIGKGVKLSEDELQVLAEADGTPSLTQGKYTVTPGLQIREDVGVGTGNVAFPGNVVVGGDVQDGFTVKAEGEITVRGVVQAATLESAGQVTLMAGMFGREKGMISAGGDVRATFLQECTVHTEGNVLVSSEIVRCNVVAKGAVEAAGSGRIIGGTITASRVSADVIGSPIGRVPTRIVLPGAPPRRRRRRNQEDAEEPAAEAEAEPETVRPTVKVRGTVYPPTYITIGNARRTIDLEIQYAAFAEVDGEITMTPYA